jgi:hypothetical protein
MALAATTVALMGAIASTESAAGGAAPSVRVATTGNDSELVKTLPITRKRGSAKRVVMSMKPSALPDLAAGDRLRVTAEIQVTVNCNYRSPRCVGPIYHYSPNVQARLVLAASERATGGPQTLRLGRAKRETCTQHRPDFEHHCVLVFTDAGIDIGDAGQLPCPLDGCYVNLVADAHHARARGGDLIMVGGQRPDGKIPQDRGRINAIRYRGTTAADYEFSGTDHRLLRHLRPDLQRRVVFSQRLNRLQDGEQLAVAATMRTDISHLPYAVRTSARLILAESPHAVRQGEFVKHHAYVRGEIAENNGSNCTQEAGTCVYRKVGVLEMRRDAVNRRSRPVALYVNLVTVFGPKARKARPGDRITLRHGGIEVVRFPAVLNG